MILKKIIKRLFYRLRSNQTTEDLIARGLIIGDNFHRMHDVIIDPSHCWLIEIGNNVTLAPRVHILAHDASTKNALDYTKVGTVTIGNNVFVGAETVILPNVKIGSNIVIGANSTISKDLPSNGVYVGSPAKLVASFETFIEKNEELMSIVPIYGTEFTLARNITIEMKQRMKSELKNNFGFIK